MNLVIDSGNTRIKYHIFSNGELEYSFFTDEPKLESLTEICNKYTVDKVIAIDSGIFPGEMKEFLEHMEGYLQFDDTLELPISVLYDDMKSLGKDRLAGAIGAWNQFKDVPLLSIDCGTCITTNFVSASGEYQGGSISPGFRMRMEAMAEFTDKLPFHTPDVPETDPGANTRDSMLSGGFWGIVYELNGRIESYLEEYPDLKVFLTGGDAHWFESRLNYEIFARPNLVAEGLDTILRYND